MTKVAAYVLKGNGLAGMVVPFMVKGAEAIGDEVTVYSDSQYDPYHLEKYDTAVFWGYVETCQRIMREYVDAGKAVVYLDLAYWHRDTCYKVSINNRHPTKYFQNVTHDDIRSKRFVPQIKPYRQRPHILLAGLSAKAAWAVDKMPPGSWETETIAEIKKYTDRPIIYRPKPSWTGAKPLPGSEYSVKTLASDIARSGSVVAWHSNVIVDGLIEGCSAFSWEGAGSVMSLQDLSKIETPWYPENREQFINDLAYCQWSKDEMRDGTCWTHLKGEGLVK